MPNEVWTDVPFFGSKGTFFADVTGDGLADLIAVNSNGIIIRRSCESSFGPNEVWSSTAFYGEKSTFFADVNGDGKADAIAVNNNGILVRKAFNN
ncbi:MAG: VCBS repeat-containing protein [Saprospiraceae bacterium]|nr:VCBS repeat-containing protein [Candidatus Defluviibacterium haderslevense]